jgi:hypothetical protein
MGLHIYLFKRDVIIVHRSIPAVISNHGLILIIVWRYFARVLIWSYMNDRIYHSVLKLWLSNLSGWWITEIRSILNLWIDRFLHMRRYVWGTHHSFQFRFLDRLRIHSSCLHISRACIHQVISRMLPLLRIYFVLSLCMPTSFNIWSSQMSLRLSASNFQSIMILALFFHLLWRGFPNLAVIDILTRDVYIG